MLTDSVFPVLILLGPPGVGKGTQSRRIAEVLRIPNISSGDILRENVRDGGEAGEHLKMILERGELVPDSLVCDMVASRIAKADCEKGFIMDGFPRTREQAEFFQQRLTDLSTGVTRRHFEPILIRFCVAESTILERLSGRRVCPTCGGVYNVHSQPPSVAGRCNTDGSTLLIRDDDQPHTILRRLQIYEQEAWPLMEFYAGKSKMFEIDGDQPLEAITSEVMAMVRQSFNSWLNPSLHYS